MSEDEFDVYLCLAGKLDECDSEQRGMYGKPEGPEEEVLHRALDEVAGKVLDLFASGQIPEILTASLAEYKPWEHVQERVWGLLGYGYVLERAELEVAGDAISRLSDVRKRVRLSLLAFHLLRSAKPTPTAEKYLRQLSKLYLAGFTAEVFIMCGAVLEAAIAGRFPDQYLRSKNLIPQYKTTGVFSIAQRMKLEKREPVFSDSDRKRFWQVVNWRNDVAHVQPDIAPDPSVALVETAYLLGRIHPAPSSDAA